MKRLFLLSTFGLAVISNSFAQTMTPKPLAIVQDSISANRHFTTDSQYLLKGYVYVTAGAVLTIDPGVIVFGDKNTKGSLIIERGAQLFANGTAAKPIVFTSHEAIGSRNYGDWGGVILCGKSPVNWTSGFAQVEGGPRSLYGGTDPHDNSGSMSYCRIEFAGIAFSPNNEINGLTFCGVGDGTHIDHIQVSYSGDDSYEWFGGSVNAKYLVALAGWDDDFDTDNGYRGKNQFCVGIRDPFAADQSGSKAFESDSYQAGTDTSNLTKPVFSNCTIIGPLVSPTSTAYDPQFVSGAHIRRSSAISILNSVIAGYPCGILIDQSAPAFGSTTANIASNELQIHNTIVCGIPTNSTPNPKELVYVVNGARSLTPTTTSADTVTGSPFAPYAGPFSWFLDTASHNKIYANEQNGVRLQNPFNLANPGCVPTSTSPICYNAAHIFHPGSPLNYDTSNNYANYNVPAFPPSFSYGKANDAFFTTVNFVGAFSGTGTTSDNWMNGWCNFDPINTDYTQFDTTFTGVYTINENSTSSIYPNPAQQSAHISFALNASSEVSIVLLDMSGKIVAELFNGKMEAGKQLFQFSTGNYANGTYIVSVKTNTENKTIKLNIIK